MKKILFTFIATLCCVGTSFAQKDISTCERVGELVYAKGTLLIWEIYNLPKAGNITCKTAIIADALADKKIGAVQISYTNPNSGEKFMSYVHGNEIDNCIQSLIYIKDKLLPSRPTVRTETEYISKDSFRFGTIYSNNKWDTYVYVSDIEDDSYIRMNSTSIASLISTLQKGKTIIEEKTK